MLIAIRRCAVPSGSVHTLVALCSALACTLVANATLAAVPELSVEDRIRAQTAIERVYLAGVCTWNHLPGDAADGCGSGTLGMDSGGLERINLDPGACP